MTIFRHKITLGLPEICFDTQDTEGGIVLKRFQLNLLINA